MFNNACCFAFGYTERCKLILVKIDIVYKLQQTVV